MTDEEIAAFLSEQGDTTLAPIHTPRPRPGVHAPSDRFSEESPLSLWERFQTSFGNPNTDPKGFKKFLKSRGYDVKRYAGDTYARKKGEQDFGNVDPFPATASEFGKDVLADVGDYTTSVPSSIGGAVGGAIAESTGGLGAAAIPVLSGAGGYVGQKLKEFIGKNLIGVTSPDAPSEASTAALSEGIASLLPMGVSALKSTAVQGSRGLMKNIVPAMYGSEIGIRDFAKKDPTKAKEIIQLLLDEGIFGTRGKLEKISDEMVPQIAAKIDEELGKSGGKIGWQDVAQGLFGNLEKKGATVDPKAEKQAVIDWIMKLKSKGTDINPGLFPVGTKKTLVEGESIKRKLNDFVKNFYKQGAQGKITPDQAEMAGQTQEIIRDLVRDLSGQPKVIKGLNKKLLAYNVLGKGTEGLEGKEFLNAMGTGASTNAFSSLAGASGGAAGVAKYKLLKLLLNSLSDIESLPVTGASVAINKISKAKNVATKPLSNALMQFLSSNLIKGAKK